MKFYRKYQHYAYGEFGNFEFFVNRIERNKDLSELAKTPLYDWWVDFRAKKDDSFFAGMYRVRVNGFHDAEEALMYGMAKFIEMLHRENLIIHGTLVKAISDD